jgi:MraZ protein
MTFFTSEYECRLDAKGRLILPARIKANLPSGQVNELVVGLGFDQCLVVYPIAEFKKIYSRIAGLSEFNPEYRKLQRNFFRGNTVVELDNSGRFLIPKNMLQYAGLQKEVIVIGMGNKVEVWNPETYRTQLYHDQAEFSGNVQKYLDSGEN